jgi:Zn-dependent peptidase ImmA (M78 family)/DNA-binding XRE family transcriptional regulator
VGARIRQARLDRGLSQEQLGHLVSKRQATISSWERGDPVPSIEDLYDIAWVLDMEVHDLLPSKRSEEPPLGLMRAIDEQLPAGTNIGAALAIFLRYAASLPAPVPTVELPKTTDPTQASEAMLRNEEAKGIPPDVVWLTHRAGVRVLPWEGMHPAISGLLVRLEDSPVIAFNPEHPEGRSRFTIAHELGHLVLGHLEELHVDVSADEGGNERPSYDARQEHDANNFAANLLMPEQWVRDKHAEGMSVKDMAQELKVSALALGYRFMSLKLEQTEKSSRYTGARIDPAGISF